MKLRVTALAFALVALLALAACGEDKSSSSVPYNYIKAEEVAKIITDNNPDYAIIDIQLEDKFNQQHLRGAIATYAYPGDKPEMHEKLKAGLEEVKENQKIIIVCPRGGGGAKNSINYYRSIGVDNSRLLILENGQEGWPSGLDDVMVKQ